MIRKTTPERLSFFPTRYSPSAATPRVIRHGESVLRRIC